MQSSSDVRTMYVPIREREKKPHRLGKKQKRQNNEKPQMQKKEEASNQKTKKTHRLGKKQKQQIKKKPETQKKAEGTNQEKKQIRKRNANNLTLLKTISLATIEVASSVWAYLENVASYKLEILKTYK